MKKNWNHIKEALQRTIIPHDADYYRKIEEQLYADLLSDREQGLAIPASGIHDKGRLIQKTLEEMLKHPLGKTLTEKPEVYFRYELSTPRHYKNIIELPFDYLHKLREEPDSLRIIRAEIAHELAHMICHDYDPQQRAYNPHQNMSERMERRADLIAAHLCGDGGAAWADALILYLPAQKLDRHYDTQSPWADRATERIIRSLDRHYPRLEKRIQYLQKWAEEFRQGKPLPDVEMPDFSSSIRRTLRNARPSPDR